MGLLKTSIYFILGKKIFDESDESFLTLHVKSIKKIYHFKTNRKGEI